MGNLVAINVMIGAAVMLFFFAPVAVQFNAEPVKRRGMQLGGKGARGRTAGVMAGLVPVVAIVSMLARAVPQLGPNFHPFRIKESPMVAWQQLQGELRGREDSVPMVVTADSADALVERLDEVEKDLELRTNEGLLDFHMMPTALVPNPAIQKAAWEQIAPIFGEQDRILSQIEAAGFSEERAALTRSVFEAWKDYGGQLNERSFSLPVGKLGKWSVDRLFAAKEGTFAALATVKPHNPEARNWVGFRHSHDLRVAALPGRRGEGATRHWKSSRVLRLIFGDRIWIFGYSFCVWPCKSGDCVCYWDTCEYGCCCLAASRIDCRSDVF